VSAEGRTDPYVGFRFLVEIDSLVVAGFSEVSGLETEMSPEEYEEGGVNRFTHKLPGRVSHPNLVLRRGLTDSRALWAWMQETVLRVGDGSVPRRNVRVMVLDSTGAESRAWVFLNAYPVKWTGPELSAGDASVAIESLELVHEGLAGGV
jgi:phage tail-like protein